MKLHQLKVDKYYIVKGSGVYSSKYIFRFKRSESYNIIMGDQIFSWDSYYFVWRKIGIQGSIMAIPIDYNDKSWKINVLSNKKRFELLGELMIGDIL